MEKISLDAAWLHMWMTITGRQGAFDDAPTSASSRALGTDSWLPRQHGNRFLPVGTIILPEGPRKDATTPVKIL